MREGERRREGVGERAWVREGKEGKERGGSKQHQCARYMYMYIAVYTMNIHIYYRRDIDLIIIHDL